MVPSRILLLGATLWLVPLGRAGASQPPAATPQTPVSQPVVQSVAIEGASELSRSQILMTGGIRLDQPLPAPLADIAADIEERYRDEGYVFAQVETAFDAASGSLTILVDEGRIDEVEFDGVEEPRARALADEFAFRPGDVFNGPRARAALRAVLRPSRGALRPMEGAFDAFELIRRNGRRVLRVLVDERDGDFRASLDMGEREDWFTPVDGLVPSIGFSGAVFDQKDFNHAFLAAHLSYKMATGRAGYSLGFERPLLRPATVYVGAEVFDLTASDDRWQMTGTQASLAAFAARESFRDYYRRRGVQLNGAMRALRNLELLASWRTERHAALPVESDFSLWNRDESFRPNRGAADGRLNALLIGATYHSIGFDEESLAATYRRHQQETAFGSTVRHTDAGRFAWRADWMTEIAAPGTFGGDFDFRRHIISVRTELRPSGHEEFRARFIGGWSTGAPPPQRLFSIGGPGTVHGYGFKEVTGERLALVNFEYAIGRLDGPHLVPFLDFGRIGTAASGQGRWLKGVGFGLGLTRDLRVDVGFKLDEFPGPAQVLLQLGRSF